MYIAVASRSHGEQVRCRKDKVNRLNAMVFQPTEAGYGLVNPRAESLNEGIGKSVRPIVPPYFQPRIMRGYPYYLLYFLVFRCASSTLRSVICMELRKLDEAGMRPA